jgi:hypothetical protein
LTTIQSTVLRNGQPRPLPSEQVVPGDGGTLFTTLAHGAYLNAQYQTDGQFAGCCQQRLRRLGDDEVTAMDGTGRSSLNK